MFCFYAFQQYLPHIIDTLIKSLHLPISCRFDNLCRKANHPASIVDHGWFYRPKLWHEQPLIKVKRSCHHQIAFAPISRPSLFISADHSLPKYRRIDRRRLIRNEAITSKCPKITFSAEWNWLRSHEGVFFQRVYDLKRGAFWWEAAAGRFSESFRHNLRHMWCTPSFMFHNWLL